MMRVSLVDFMYAIVIGSAFPLIAPIELSFRFFGMLFLLLVILEDFYLYHTQIVSSDKAAVGRFITLVLEIAILLAWYLCVIAFSTSSDASLVAYGAFFLLKLAAATAHFDRLKLLGSWRYLRSFSFLIPISVACVLACCGWGGRLSSFRIWGIVASTWAVQVTIWWGLTKHYKRVSAATA